MAYSRTLNRKIYFYLYLFFYIDKEILYKSIEFNLIFEILINKKMNEK